MKVFKTGSLEHYLRSIITKDGIAFWAIKSAFIEIKYEFFVYPWQRITRGYDSTPFTYGLDWYLSHFLNEYLEKMKDSDSYPAQFDTQEEWLVELEKMRLGFRQYVETCRGEVDEKYYNSPIIRFEEDPEFRENFENSWTLLKAHIHSLWT